MGVGVLPHVMWPVLPLRVPSTQICFISRPTYMCLGYYEKSRDICVFWSDKLISNFNVLNNIKITLHYRVYMRTSDKAERVQTVSYSHIRSLSGLYTVVCLREGKRGTCLGPPLQLQCVYLAFKGTQQQLQCTSGLLCFRRAPNSSCL